MAKTKATLSVEVEGHVEADAVAAFWRAIALLAAETLDDGDLAGEDRGPQEEAA
jgi:hypothetical protein